MAIVRGRRSCRRHKLQTGSSGGGSGGHGGPGDPARQTTLARSGKWHATGWPSPRSTGPKRPGCRCPGPSSSGSGIGSRWAGSRGWACPPRGRCVSASAPSAGPVPARPTARPGC